MTFSQLEDEILRMHSAARRHDPCRAGPLLEGEHAEEVVTSAVTRSALLVDPFLRQFDRVLVGLLKRRARFVAREYGLPCVARLAMCDHPRPGHPSTGSHSLRVG